MAIQEEGSFIRPLGKSARQRLWIKRDRKQIIEYVVQLEVETSEGWQPVVRYDTEYEKPHRDVHRPSGRQEDKTWLASHVFDRRWGFKQSLEYALKDIENNWPEYLKNFLMKEGKSESK